MRGFTLVELIIFIIIAALVIPAFFIATSPVVKNAILPTAMVKARFLGESKMEEIMAYTLDDPGRPAEQVNWVNVDATDFPGYQWYWRYFWVTCDNASPIDPTRPCVGYTGTSIVNAGSDTGYQKISVYVRGPSGSQYEAHTMVTRR